MNRFAGLPFMCLMFLSTHANSEISGSNWSLQLSQNNGEPVQLQMEGEEFDKNGVTSYKSEGIIEDGVYKPTNEFKDFSPRESHLRSTNNLNRESRDIDALLKIADQYENGEMDFQKDDGKMSSRHGEDFEAGIEEKSLASGRCHPRHHGKREHFRKYNPFGKHNPRKFLKKKHFHSGAEEFAKEKPHYARIPDSKSTVVSEFETTENELKNLLKFLQIENMYSKLAEFVKGKSYYMDIPDSESEAIKNRFKNRSRVSPIDRLKKYWKKLLELKKQNSKNQDDSKRKLKIIRVPARPFPPEEGREYFEGQNPAETEELLGSMREFEEGILNEYYDAEK